MVASCVYPVTGEIEVATDSEKWALENAAHAPYLTPHNETIQKLAREYGVTQVTRFAGDPDEECVLCNLCVRACEQLGAGAIFTVNRGITKKVATLFEEPAEECIGCAACAAVCPAGAIKVLEEDGKRIIWNREFEMAACSRCGELFATAEQLAFYNTRLNVITRMAETALQKLKRAVELLRSHSPHPR